jgi:hypothetical protein
MKIFGRKSDKFFLRKKYANCFYVSRSKEDLVYQVKVVCHEVSGIINYYFNLSVSRFLKSVVKIIKYQKKSLVA